jgi:hypothetical protein
MQTENRVINEWDVFAAVTHEPIDLTARTTLDALQSRCLVRLAFYSEHPRGPARVFASHSSRHRIPTRHGMAGGPHEWLLGSHSDNPLGTARGPVRSRELTYPAGFGSSGTCRVEVWRGDCRSNISVSAPFVWRCLTGSPVAPFPHPAHRTGHAELPHPAPGQDITPSPMTRRAQAGSAVRARSARKGARVDKPRPCVA